MTEISAKYQAIFDNAPGVPNLIKSGGIGLCGAHRTGKTTLAIALSKKLNIPFLPINTSEVFAANHLDPAKPMDFKTRLGIQRRILNHSCLEWEVAKLPFICNRTPIDMMAYTLAEVQGKTLDVFMESELNYYLDDCKSLTEKYFNYLILVPPDIPIVKAMVQGYAIEKGATELDQRVADVVRWLNV